MAIVKNTNGDMMVLSMEVYENLELESEIYLKLKEAEMEAQYTDKCYSGAEAFKMLREELAKIQEI